MGGEVVSGNVGAIASPPSSGGSVAWVDSASVMVELESVPLSGRSTEHFLLNNTRAIQDGRGAVTTLL